jgi:hypothetical protein
LVISCVKHLIFSHKAELGKELKDAQVDTAAVSETNNKFKELAAYLMSYIGEVEKKVLLQE